MCDFSTDALSYYGDTAAINYLVCIDARAIEGYLNPLCGCAVDAGFGCNRWEAL